MRRFRPGPHGSAPLAAAWVATVLCLSPLPAAAETLAITNAHALPMSGKAVILDATIVVRDGVIESVGAGTAVPEGARVIDAEGRFVTPGLVAPATRLGLVEIGSVEDAVDTSNAKGELGAGFDIRYGLNPNSVLVEMARADGVTRAVSFPAGSAQRPFLGTGAGLVLREGPDILDVPGIGVFVEIGAANTGEAGRSRAQDWQTLRRVLGEVKALEDGDEATPDQQALLPVAAGERPLAILAQRESDIREAIALASDYDLDLVLVGAAEGWRAADALAQAGIPVLVDPVLNLPMNFDQFGARPDNARLLMDAGVTVAFYVSGADMNYNAGLALREAAGIAWSNGISREQALAAVTVNAARAWGQGQSYGSIEPGRAADLVIWDGDPLEPASAPEQVLVNGEPVSLRTRQTELRDRYHPHRED